MNQVIKHCAVYTRKSTDERLEMEFNSLDAQREACLAYITSQKAEGWQPLQKQYNDGGFSGGNIQRPALAELMADIKAGKVNTVVVYKIDRLTRSLTDFVKLVEVFDRHNVTFVSVTQSFNTTTSMGRLTLNVLLSFAQFEREVAGERIRDKIAASKKKGMFMGGTPPMGYKVKNRKLVIDNQRAELTTHIYERYLALGSTIALERELEAQGIKSPDRISNNGKKHEGAVFSRGALQQILTNPLYIGKIKHKEAVYNGQHPGIIPLKVWNEVQYKLQSQAVSARGSKKSADESLLRKLLFDFEGNPYKPSFTNKDGKRYRYYICDNDDSLKLPAHEIETIVEQSIRNCLSNSKKAAETLSLHEEYDCFLLSKIAEHCPTISTHELFNAAIKKVAVSDTKVISSLDITALRKLLRHHIKADFPDYEFKSTHTIEIPYVRTRVSKGAIVIEPQAVKKDTFDLPPPELKKLIQGFVWCDEHFKGLTISQIAQREKVSDSYIGKQIFKSFDGCQL